MAKVLHSPKLSLTFAPHLKKMLVTKEVVTKEVWVSG